jgi:two-component system, NtrC family, sensor kinase
MCERLVLAHQKTEGETIARMAALEQLRHADRLISVGRLAAGVVHELGRPLNVVAGRVKMLRRQTLDLSVMDEYLAIIAEQAERMSSIIRQLMDSHAGANQRLRPRISPASRAPSSGW